MAYIHQIDAGRDINCNHGVVLRAGVTATDQWVSRIPPECPSQVFGDLDDRYLGGSTDALSSFTVEGC